MLWRGHGREVGWVGGGEARHLAHRHGGGLEEPEGEVGAVIHRSVTIVDRKRTASDHLHKTPVLMQGDEISDMRGNEYCTCNVLRIRRSGVGAH